MTVAGAETSEDLSAAALGSVGGINQLPTPRNAVLTPRYWQAVFRGNSPSKTPSLPVTGSYRELPEFPVTQESAIGFQAS